MGTSLRRWGRGATSRGPADGTHSAPGVLRTGRACPHLGSWVPPIWRDEGVRGRSGEHSRVRMQGRARWTGAVYVCGAG
jgi:hypothetical protein